MTAAAVVVAAGRGTRFDDAGPPKQFRELEGEPLAARACRPFLAVPGLEPVVLVLPPDVAGDPPPWVEALGVRVAAGGAARRDSVGRGLAALPEATETVLVHDGARPLVTRGLVERVLEVARGGSAVVPGLPLRDTVKEVDAGGRVVRTLDRSRLRRIQTPQGFPAATLRRAHRAAPAGAAATDDASLCEAIGTEVHTVEGDPENLKVTTPEDLARAAWILRRRRSGVTP